MKDVFQDSSEFLRDCRNQEERKIFLSFNRPIHETNVNSRIVHKKMIKQGIKIKKERACFDERNPRNRERMTRDLTQHRAYMSRENSPTPPLSRSKLACCEKQAPISAMTIITSFKHGMCLDHSPTTDWAKA